MAAVGEESGVDQSEFEPVCGDAWRENVPEDLQEIGSRAIETLTERVRHALAFLQDGAEAVAAERRWSEAGYRKLATHGKKEEKTRAFCTWEHNIAELERVPECVSVMRLPCDVEHVKKMIDERWEMRPKWDFNCAASVKGRQFNPLCSVFQNRFKSRLLFSKRVTCGFMLWRKLKNGGWFLTSAGLPHNHSLAGEPVGQGLTPMTLNVGGYHIVPGVGEHAGTCRVVVLLHVDPGGTLSFLSKRAYIMSLGNNFTRAIYLWRRWVLEDWTSTKDSS